MPALFGNVLFFLICKKNHISLMRSKKLKVTKNNPKRTQTWENSLAIQGNVLIWYSGGDLLHLPMYSTQLKSVIIWTDLNIHTSLENLNRIGGEERGIFWNINIIISIINPAHSQILLGKNPSILSKQLWMKTWHWVITKHNLKEESNV